jgi:hypothetical protein
VFLENDFQSTSQWKGRSVVEMLRWEPAGRGSNPGSARLLEGSGQRPPLKKKEKKKKN